MDQFGDALRMLRQREGWRQQDLADHLGDGIARSTIANVEAGRQQPTERLWAALTSRCPEWSDSLSTTYLAARDAAATRRQSLEQMVQSVGGVPSGPLGGPFLVEQVRYVYVFRHSRSPEEIIEHRRVRALEAGADGYGLWFAQTRSDRFEMEYEALWGGHLAQQDLRQADGRSVVLQRFAFDRRLRRNQVHDFALRSWITQDPEPATAVSFNFSIPARQASICLHFSGPHPPAELWRYQEDAAVTASAGAPTEEEPPDHPEHPAWLHLDPLGSVTMTIDSPTLNVHYGVAWTW